jgi:hypothetical protein
MKPPLGNKEVETITQQLERKEYFYKCDDQPIASFCNKELCITRKFGIGPGQKSNDLGSLTKINGDPPIWILDVDGQRVELSTDSLVSQMQFQKDCLSQINLFPKTMSTKAWQGRMQVLLSQLTIVEVPPEATRKGEFEDHLTSFCCDRARGTDREDVLQGISVWAEGKVFFQVKDLKRYLTNNQFNYYSAVHIGLRLREFGADKMFWNVKGKGVHVWGIRQDFFSHFAPVSLDLPPIHIEKDIM